MSFTLGSICSHLVASPLWSSGLRPTWFPSFVQLSRLPRFGFQHPRLATSSSLYRPAQFWLLACRQRTAQPIHFRNSALEFKRRCRKNHAFSHILLARSWSASNSFVFGVGRYQFYACMVYHSTVWIICCVFRGISLFTW